MFDMVRAHESDILTEWMTLQLQSGATRRDLINEADLQRQSRDFLAAFGHALETGTDVSNPAWTPVKEQLARISAARALQGFAPSETAAFVLSLKQPLFAQLRRAAKDAAALADDTWTVTALIDALGLYTTEVHQKSRENVIVRQQQEMMELSTPVVRL